MWACQQILLPSEDKESHAMADQRGLRKESAWQRQTHQMVHEKSMKSLRELATSAIVDEFCSSQTNFPLHIYSLCTHQLEEACIAWIHKGTDGGMFCRPLFSPLGPMESPMSQWVVAASELFITPFRSVWIAIGLITKSHAMSSSRMLPLQLLLSQPQSSLARRFVALRSEQADKPSQSSRSWWWMEQTMILLTHIDDSQRNQGKVLGTAKKEVDV